MLLRKPTNWPLPLAVVSWLLSYASSSPVDTRRSPHIIEDLALLKSRQLGGPFFAIRGVQDGAIQPRLEIRDLERDHPDQWNVYLLGLDRMQKMNQNDELSWYQIAGIHGRPYTAWDGVQQAPGGGGGYCTHDSNLFPTWHRPYLALFETVLYAHCQDVAQEFPAGPQKDRYVAAAATLRIPYWDWAVAPPADEGVLPGSMTRAKVQVVMPNGTNTIDNPLFAYRFHPLNRDDFFTDDSPEKALYPTTLRYPNSRDARAVSRNELADNDLSALRPNMKARVYHIMTMVKDYYNVSSDETRDDSIESVHDAIHVSIGGTWGHMTEVPYAAFDPAFWLHHAMVDRLFALWQALYPDSYVEPMSQKYPTFSFPQGSVLDAGTPLRPFHSGGDGTFWNSNTARYTTAFGYTYPELQSNDTAALNAEINRKYGPSLNSQKRTIDHRNSEPKDGLTGRASPAEVFQLDERAAAITHSTAAPTNQYFANINVQKFGVGGSFAVFISIGDLGPDPAVWAQDPNFVGVDGVFAAAKSDAGDKNIQTNGLVPLSAELKLRVARGELASLEEKAVERYLTEKLRWRVRKMDNTEIPIAQVPDLKVAVLAAQVRPARSVYEFPEMDGEYKVLCGVTDGRPAGFSKGDTL